MMQRSIVQTLLWQSPAMHFAQQSRLDSVMKGKSLTNCLLLFFRVFIFRPPLFLNLLH